MRRLLLIFCLVLSAPAAHAQNLPLYRIAYGTTGENPTVLWIAVEQGFYRRHGVNAEVLYMRS
ncbi:MAG TPA: hypothetical protein VGL11_16560, partial [Candidatus Binatia bacterium]